MVRNFKLTLLAHPVPSTHCLQPQCPSCESLRYKVLKSQDISIEVFLPLWVFRKVLDSYQFNTAKVFRQDELCRSYVRIQNHECMK